MQLNLEAGVWCSPDANWLSPNIQDTQIFEIHWLFAQHLVCTLIKPEVAESKKVAFRVIRMNNDYRIHDGHAKVRVMRSQQNDF